jgi:hypothetical protein
VKSNPRVGSDQISADSAESTFSRAENRLRQMRGLEFARDSFALFSLPTPWPAERRNAGVDFWKGSQPRFLVRAALAKGGIAILAYTAINVVESEIW